MKFWFFSSDGAIVILLALSTVFCDQDIPSEINATSGNTTMEIPCSLDEIEGNGTDCRNTSQVSSSPESWVTSNPNSNEHLTSTSCPPEGCTENYEAERNASSFEISPGSTLTNLSKTDNIMENNITTEHSTITTIILPNETYTSCPPEGCSMNYKPENDSSEILPQSTLTTLPKTNLIENNLTTVTTIIPSNETYMFENSSTYESVLITEETNEKVSNTSDVDKLTPLVELHNNNSLPSENTSMTSQAINVSTISTELSNSFSNSSEDNFSEESLYSNNSLLNTTLPSIITHHMEENDTITDTFVYTELNVTNTSDYFSHISEVNNSTEKITLTETSDTFVTLQNITDKDVDASTLTTRLINESFDNVTELVENTTTNDYPVTSSQIIQDLTMNVTSTPDDSTAFYTMPFSLNSSDSSINTSIPTVTEHTNFSTDTSSDSLVDTTTVVSSEFPLTPPHRINIVVELRINCSGNKEEKAIALSVAELLNATLKNDYDKDCKNLHNVTLSVLQDSRDFAAVYRLVSKKLKNAELIRIMYDESANTSSKNVTLAESDVTQSEMILYITLGVCLGAIFLIALAIICFKCCRRRPSKPIDLDVPHLNLRLEDYTLTRIPRPNTVYLDYFRGPIVSDRYSTAPLGNSMNTGTESDRGLVQPFDTSVVPLEDAKKLDQLAISPGRTSSTCPSTPLRTFGRKDWKRGDNLIYENVISSSTEKLHPDFYKYGYPGMENPTFAA